MAQIRIDLNEPLLDGMDIKFQAPCDCTAITGLIVYYPAADGTTASKSFVFKDTHGNVLSGLGNLFSRGAYVKVIVNVVDGIAYIQNADTNGYLEEKLSNHTHPYLPLTGGTLTGAVKINGITLTEGVDYGNSLPTTAPVGKLFFVKVGS